jgi:hypothetical protein
MKPITADKGTAVPPSYIPLPWQVFAEFWRLVCLGCVVTFGPHPGRSAVVAGLILLIACSNISSLLLGRSVLRTQEVEVRAALGVGKWA